MQGDGWNTDQVTHYRRARQQRQRPAQVGVQDRKRKAAVEQHISWLADYCRQGGKAND